MAIASLDQYIASAKQNVQYVKTATRTSIAASWFSVIDLAGQPGAGQLAGLAFTASGSVPTDATIGHPTINSFGGGATGYISRFEAASSVACRIALYDCLFVAGSYAFNANTTLASQPSYASRVPGANYSDLELWFEAATAFTTNLSLAVTYTNQSGTSGRTTGTVAFGLAPTVGRCIQMPLQQGDSGIQRVDSVTATVSTAGTFNIRVMRQLAAARVTIANMADIQDLMRTGMPDVFADSALYALIAADGTSTGIPEMQIQIANA